MDDKSNEIFRQYDLKVVSMYRARGAFILETNQGLKLYKSFEGSKNHLEFENKLKQSLIDRGVKNVDLCMHNKMDELISMDSSGGKYIIKNWFAGSECNLRDQKDVCRATKNLALLHKALTSLELTQEEKDSYKQDELVTTYEKHNRELKRVRSYIREKKQRNEFEKYFTMYFEDFYNQGLEAMRLLQESEYVAYLQKAVDENQVCHGNYTYHNVIFLKEETATTNFEKAGIGVQVYDLYHFMRKTMEKNSWEVAMGDAIISEYTKILPLSKVELKLLYVMLLYPEKFWKVTNYYYNNKKSWISQRNIQKLVGLQQQSEIRSRYLRQLFQQI